MIFSKFNRFLKKLFFFLKKLFFSLRQLCIHKQEFNTFLTAWGYSYDDIFMGMKGFGRAEGESLILDQVLSKYCDLEYVTTFAAARMAIFSFLKAIGIATDDEVIVTGYTCSVVINAILRTGASVRYCDINKEHFGTDFESLTAAVSSKTKVVIVQHSFGIPCRDIEKICKFCRTHNIKVLEDCSISLGSKINDHMLGTFGDAMVISFDHTKPINAFSGGAILTNSNSLHKKIRDIWNKAPSLSSLKQKVMRRQYFLERYMVVNELSRYIDILNLFIGLLSVIFPYFNPFLSDERGAAMLGKRNYAYPAKMPSFCCALATRLVPEYFANLTKFENRLKNMQEILQEQEYGGQITLCVPHRYLIKRSLIEGPFAELKKYIDIEQSWFLEPIINRSGSLKSFHYSQGMCPVAEQVGRDWVNIPMLMLDKNFNAMMSVIRQIVSKKKYV